MGHKMVPDGPLSSFFAWRLSVFVPLGRRYGDCVSPRAMAMRGLADEMNAIGDMKAAGFIDSPTEKDLRAAATASALGQPTPRALMATAPGES